MVRPHQPGSGLCLGFAKLKNPLEGNAPAGSAGGGV